MDNITINLKNSADAKDFQRQDLVHQKEFDLASGWINESIERATEIQPLRKAGSFTKDRIHNTITVLGTRGSGKTSFLLSLLNQFSSDNSEAAVMAIIDPTLIEDKGHIFLVLISIIKEMVETRLDLSDFDPTKPDYQEKTAWRKLIEKMAKGLPSLDGVGAGFGSSAWQDHEYIMQKGIAEISAARKLEENFNRVVEKALTILGKTVLIIAFDDIDIDFKKGWPVLETIRKYLTSPKIITVLSGDMNLYSLAIKKQQWENFGKDFLAAQSHKPTRMLEYERLITEMESQYLLKVMKPERRIHLTTLHEKLNTRGTDIKINIKPEHEKELELIDFYDKILNVYGIRNSYQAEIYRSFLLASPLRMQIRFLTEFDPLKNSLREANITDPFLSNLLEKGIDVNLANGAPKFLNILILELLLNEKVLGESYQLQPSSTDPSLNGSLIALSLLFSRTVSLDNPELIFDYLIKVGYTRNLFSSIGYSNTGSLHNPPQTEPSVQGLCKHSGILQDKVLRDVTGLMTAYVSAYLETEGDNPIWSGIIPLLSTNEIRRQRRELVSDRIDVVSSESSAISQALIYFPLSVCKDPANQNNKVVYSIYSLLGTIGEIIKKIKADDLDRGLLEFSQLRTYSMPDFKRKINSRVDESGAIELDDDEDNDRKNRRPRNEMDPLKKILESWVDAFPSDAISPHLLGKIATRMFYAFDDIQDSKTVLHLGDAMHYRIVALLNSILIEDIKENVKGFGGLRINNTKLNEINFITNLRNVKQNECRNLLIFSRWMISCPLLLVYLDSRNERLMMEIREFVHSPFSNVAFELTIYPYLARVSTKGKARSVDSSDKPPKYDEIIRDFAELNITISQIDSASRTKMPNQALQNMYRKRFNKPLSYHVLKQVQDYITKLNNAK